MRMSKKQSEAAQRYAERRQREDEAPRLKSVAPELVSLSVEVEDGSGAGMAASRHVRHVVVESAPALFVIPCGEQRCDGGHDVTYAVLGALRERRTSFDGVDECRGSVGMNPCMRILRYHAVAEYELGVATRGRQ
jgi:hypothetical protein